MLSFLTGSNKRYVDTRVNPAYLERLQKAMDEEHSPKKYFKYKAWLHYANLKSWQEQGWHFAYLNYMGKELHCTCGLVVSTEILPTSDIEPNVLEKLNGFRLDPVQLQTGHRALPSLASSSVAILVNFKWVEEKDCYVWDGICQNCGEYSLGLKGREIMIFENKHNLNC